MKEPAADIPEFLYPIPYVLIPEDRYLNGTRVRSLWIWRGDRGRLAAFDLLVIALGALVSLVALPIAVFQTFQRFGAFLGVLAIVWNLLVAFAFWRLTQQFVRRVREWLAIQCVALAGQSMAIVTFGRGGCADWRVVNHSQVGMTVVPVVIRLSRSPLSSMFNPLRSWAVFLEATEWRAAIAVLRSKEEAYEYAREVSETLRITESETVQECMGDVRIGIATSRLFSEDIFTVWWLKNYFVSRKKTSKQLWEPLSEILIQSGLVPGETG